MIYALRSVKVITQSNFKPVCTTRPKQRVLEFTALLFRCELYDFQSFNILFDLERENDYAI